MLADLRTLGAWAPRRWLVAAGVAIAYLFAVAIPTDLLDTPVFSRDVPPTWWAWPSLLASALLVGLLVASYVADRPSGAAGSADSPQPSRFGVVGSLLTFFAVGCPVCNKVVLLALGYAGALTWFQPLQPLLQAGAIGLLAWALHARLRGQRSCPLDPATASTPSTSGAPSPENR